MLPVERERCVVAMNRARPAGLWDRSQLTMSEQQSGLITSHHHSPWRRMQNRDIEVHGRDQTDLVECSLWNEVAESISGNRRLVQTQLPVSCQRKTTASHMDLNTTGQNEHDRWQGQSLRFDRVQ